MAALAPALAIFPQPAELVEVSSDAEDEALDEAQYESQQVKQPTNTLSKQTGPQLRAALFQECVCLRCPGRFRR